MGEGDGGGETSSSESERGKKKIITRWPLDDRGRGRASLEEETAADRIDTEVPAMASSAASYSVAALRTPSRRRRR